MNTQSLAQRRAARAWSRIENHKNRGAASYGNYVRYVESLPATILMNGLGQACATLLSKAEAKLDKPHGLLYADLQDWLCRNDEAAPYPKAADLMQAIIDNGQQKYFRAQTEALAYLVWLKKFANAYLDQGKPE